ncbi:hypothetical protein SAMN05518801_11151 [Novosphingobium sp. CF614]|uniref:DUF1491 family protein n=1 Tax=Novosphingobium sp. CF614 TaxID=1884364 RepID=UPI0008E346D9|nr:DUF1491 family protein [Novosphingobium sp. CF614]SFG22801.1 hypothetical protein SAMN05518801_11151 [Novosphingobium sp. CF614]
MASRLPAHLEVAALIRSVEAEGGFAAVLSKGERDAGAIMVVLTEKGGKARAYERMPQLDGTRAWSCSKEQDIENKQEFSEYLTRRSAQDPDLWIIELDVAQGERFIGLTGEIS